MNSKRAMQGIIDRLSEAVYYKVYRDLCLYGECVLDASEETINELVEIRERLDNER